MAKAEDLTDRLFGNLRAISRAKDRVTPSGQKRRFWNCECLLCGTRKAISAQSLKNGDATSCGCWRAVKGMQNRNTKICVECGKTFYCPPSSKTVTCSKECRRIHAKKRQTGAVRTDQTRDKISASAKGRDMTDLQKMGTQAAMASPNSGRFETNVNAVDWHLVSPEGEHFYFRSLNNWLRKNGAEYFGCEPDSREYNNVKSGLSGAKRAVMGKKYGSCTYKGWQAIPVENETDR